MPPKSNIQKKATKATPPKVSRKLRITKKNTNADGDYVDQNDETIYDHEIDLVPTNNNNNNNNNINNNNDAIQLDAVINALSTNNTNQLVNQTPPKTTVRLWSNAETGMLLLLCNGCPALGKSPQGIPYSTISFLFP